ncbi:MAG: VanZ family protein [Acidobacteriota bacterium]
MLTGRNRFAPAILLALVSLGVSPFMGLLRDVLFSALGGSALKVLGGALALLGLAVMIATVLSIRDRRAPRYGLLAAVAVLLLIQTFVLGSGHAKVDLVEKVHIFQYGALAVLLYWALLPANRIVGPAILGLPLLWATLVGVGEESVQGFFRFRVADIRDVALNSIAACCGVFLALALWPPDGWVPSSGERRRLLRWAAVLVLAVGVFFHTVHVGYLIHDEDIGHFRSWFSQSELESLAEERAVAWAEEPPDGRAWHRKDYYLWEAASYANHRNASYNAGHWTLAWQANRILERYYGPFLDLPRFRNAGKHRYGPEVWRQLEGKATPDPATYLSPVHGDSLYTWPRGLFLAMVVSLAGGLGAASIRSGP